MTSCRDTKNNAVSLSEYVSLCLTDDKSVAYGIAHFDENSARVRLWIKPGIPCQSEAPEILRGDTATRNFTAWSADEQ